MHVVVLELPFFNRSTPTKGFAYLVRLIKQISFCFGNTLDSNLIKRKIVVCTASQHESSFDKSIVVRDGGGIGIILTDQISGNEDVGYEHVIPTTILDPKQVETLQDYFILNNQLKPTARGCSATIKIGATIQAPKMAVFSSRGPNPIAPDIIKPDITAPDVNILAAWPPASGEGVGYYKFESGTSMSCPHVSAVAAIIKSYHPTWSPEAIKSAIMTTATEMDNTKRPMVRNLHGSSTTPLDYGSGHINPAAALDPGLVYDYNTTDMINFLCNSIDVNLTIFPSLVTCPNPPIPNYDINYPSIGVSELNGHVLVRRTVTYCGQGPTVFKENLLAPAGVTITLKPKELEFKKAGEHKSFDVNFVPDKTSFGGVVFGSLTWSNGKYNVRSPILVGVIKMQ
ncbi:subtilisin-like protease SBT5.4 [Papaver somniferum]|uniref:subtilisin-like protease SBT5.4 n=1 Tax=Papaver somniferum TaxID=3469 RepID=UPI000E704A76|nr:subtilisin-like protease SBT5.4 [Papaver somniferum]